MYNCELFFIKSTHKQNTINKIKMTIDTYN